MTNHNKKLDEILAEHGAEPGEMTHSLKQALTSLHKELVAEARIKEVEYSVGKLESSEEYAVRRIAELREKVGQDDTK